MLRLGVSPADSRSRLKDKFCSLQFMKLKPGNDSHPSPAYSWHITLGTNHSGSHTGFCGACQVVPKDKLRASGSSESSQKPLLNEDEKIPERQMGVLPIGCSYISEVYLGAAEFIGRQGSPWLHLSLTSDLWHFYFA